VKATYRPQTVPLTPYPTPYSYTLHPTPVYCDSLSLKSQASNLKLQASSIYPKPQAPNPKPQAQDPKPQAPNPKF